MFHARWAEIIAYTMEELLPASVENWTKNTHPDDLRAWQALLQRQFRGELLSPKEYDP